MKTPRPDDESFKEAERRLLTAASSAHVPPPFFSRRVAALARTRSAPNPVSQLAWRLLPVLSVFTLAVIGWGAYETSRFERATDNVVSGLTSSASGATDAILAAAFLGAGSAPVAADRGPR
jgi:hypothetical protein